MKFKLWLWILEFKLKRVADDKKIEFLAQNLLKELELQGYDLMGTGVGYVTIYIHNKEVTVENIQRRWSVGCGNYKMKGDK